MAKEAWKKVVGAELVPVLDDVVKVLLKTQTETNGTLAATKSLAADGSIKRWAQNGALGLAMLADIINTTIDLARLIGLAFVAVGADSTALATKLASLAAPFDANVRQMAESAAIFAEEMRAKFNAAWDKGLDPGKFQKKLQAEFDASAAAAARASAHFAEHGDTLAKVRKQITGLGGDTKAAGETTVMAYSKIIAAIGERMAAESAMLNGGDKLTEGQKYALSVMKDLTSTTVKFTDAQKIAVTKALEQYLATEKVNKAAEERKKLLEQMLKLQSEQLAIEVQVIGAAADRTRAMADENEKLREQITTFGMTEQQVNDLNIARLQSKLVTYEAAKATGYLTEQDAKAAEEIAAQIDLLRERNGLLGSKEVLDQAKKMQDDLKSVWQGIGNDISNWIMSGFKNTRDLLKRMFETLVLRPIISPIANGLAGGLQGLLGGLLGGSGGAGGGGGLLSGLLGNSGLLGGILGTGAGGIGGGILAGLIGPGSGLGSALGLASAVGPPTALAGAGVAGGAGSLGGSISSLIGAIPGWGWAAMAAAAVAALFIKDEKGIKFDNSLRNVAAAPANVQQAMLGNFAPSGDVDGKLLGAIQPFITKVQALDKYIGTNLLSDDTLAQVRERIQALQNPRWWNLEDKDAIEKASKYFLQQRYGAAFESINEQVATTIKTFQGSADELLAYIDSFITMRETVLAAQRAAQDAISGTSEALQGMLDQQSNSVLAAYRAQQRGVGDLLNIAPDAENALAQLVTGMSSFRSAALQMMLQIKQVQDAIGGMFGDTIRSLQLSVMTPEQQYAFLQNEADQLLQQALQSNDPLQIQQLMQRLNADVNQAMNLLSPEQRAAVVPEQIARLTDINNQLQSRLSDLSNNVQNNLQATLQNLSDRLDKIAQANLDAAAKQNAAADKNLVAAATPNQLVLTVDLVNNTAVIGPPKEVGG